MARTLSVQGPAMKTTLVGSRHSAVCCGRLNRRDHLSRRPGAAVSLLSSGSGADAPWATATSRRSVKDPRRDRRRGVNGGSRDALVRVRRVRSHHARGTRLDTFFGEFIVTLFGRAHDAGLANEEVAALVKVLRGGSDALRVGHRQTWPGLFRAIIPEPSRGLREPPPQQPDGSPKRTATAGHRC